MKKIMLVLLGCIVSIQCFANSIQEVDGKFYVSPGSIYVAPDAIYVNIDSNFVAVNAIACDINGIYIQDQEFRLIKCLRCGYTHDTRERCPIYNK